MRNKTFCNKVLLIEGSYEQLIGYWYFPDTSSFTDALL